MSPLIQSNTNNRVLSSVTIENKFLEKDMAAYLPRAGSKKLNAHRQGFMNWLTHASLVKKAVFNLMVVFPACYFIQKPIWSFAQRSFLAPLTV